MTNPPAENSAHGGVDRQCIHHGDGETLLLCPTREHIYTANAIPITYSTPYHLILWFSEKRKTQGLRGSIQ